jgi:hypothetical protein
MAGKIATEPSWLIEDLVQIAVQNKLLQGQDPNAPSAEIIIAANRSYLRAFSLPNA